MSITFTFDGCPGDLEINMSNHNAFVFLRNLDPDFDAHYSCGEWSVERMQEIYEEIVERLEYRAFLKFTRMPNDYGVIVDIGIDDRYVEERFLDFKNLIVHAYRAGKNIVYL
jgi:hypothetical protein